MADGLVRLIWEVDSAGYEIVKKEYRPRPRSASAGLEIAKKYRRSVSLYDEIVEKKHRHREQNCIVPRSGNDTQYEASLLEYEIFRDLANSARRPGPEGVLQFVNTWGLLMDGWGESLAEFVSQRDALLAHMSGNWAFVADPGRVWGFGTDPGRGYFGELFVSLEKKRGRPPLFFQAQSLLQFCVLEFYHAKLNKIDLTACAACGELLPLHKQGRPKRYCKDACKMAAWRGKHGDVINRRRRENRSKDRSS
jgi:hypothetical protein